jgi:Ca2+-binding RTX toxin-like protein
MTVYRFSQLLSGQSVSFNPSTDVLNFDQAFVPAADVMVSTQGADVMLIAWNGSFFSHVFLTNVSPLQLTTTNITFANGSQLLFGDNSTALNDDAANVITGTAGGDLLAGFGGADTMNGGLGNDTYIVGTGDVLSDSEGFDTVVTDIDWTLGADFENLTLTGLGNLSATGHNGNNLLIGNAGDNYFNARAGNDTIQGGAGNDWIDMSSFGAASYGNDVIDGGEGLDTVNFAIGAGQRSAIVADLAAGTIRGGGEAGAGSASVTGVERVIGAAFNDQLSGSFRDEYLEGREGDDTLSGMRGHDTLVGGAGQDRFVFTDEVNSAYSDQVVDFVSATDKLVFDNAFFTTIGAPGNFAAGDARFVSGAGLTAGQDASDRLVYNTTNGDLYYDSDGNGSGGTELVATLQGAPALAATDIVVTGQALPAPIQGTEGNDSITGTAGNDFIEARGGNDTVDGLAGNDTINGQDGSDALFGGPGRDSLIGGNGSDTLEGGPGGTGDGDTDTLDGGLGDDTFIVNNQFGRDVLTDSGGIDTVVAVNMSSWELGSGFENLILTGQDPGAFDPALSAGNELDNVIRSELSRSILDGADGNDTLIGGAGSERFTFSVGSGAYGSDVIDGGAGGNDFDILEVGARSAVVVDFRAGTVTGGGTGGSGSVKFVNIRGAVGGSFDDRLVADDTGVSLVGDGGNDTLIGGSGNDTLSEDRGSDFFPNDTGNDQIFGGAGNDQIFGSQGSDLLDGGTGDDVFGYTDREQVGADTIVGGDGVDTINLFSPVNALTADLAAGRITVVGSADSVTLSGIENFRVGGNFDNRIVGSASANLLTAGQGNDTLVGSAGDDTLVGGPSFLDSTDGSDWLEGGQGADSLIGARGIDSFVFRGPEDGADRIADFAADILVFDNSRFTALGASGQLATGDQRFFAGAGATSGQDASDRLVYNTSTGDLYYDADGNGAGASRLIVTLEGAPALAATGITVVGEAAPPPPPPPSSVQGTAGNDLLTGTEGNDSISGLAGNDTINALGGDDTLDGGAGIDNLNGGLGNDTYIVTAGDVLSDTGGVDTVVTDVSWDLGAGFENLTMSGTAGIDVTGNELNNLAIGNSGNNYFNLRAGNDTVQAGAGNDWIDMSNFGSPSYGDDVVDGGDGNDTLNFATGSGQRSGVVVDLAAGTASGGGEGGVGTVRVTGIEQVIGAAFNDRISGSGAADSLEGAGGNDTLSGMGGNDSLVGGAGQDTFVFAAAPGAGNVDTVADFVSATDKLTFDASAFTAISAAGNFAAGDARFAAGAGFTSGRDGDDRIVYDTSTGSVYYDADGNGSGAAQLVATLQGAPGLTATDISVVGQTPPPPPPGTIQGTAGNDSLTGTAGNDSVDGLAGNDTIDGRGGDDTLLGGAGNDSIRGSAGADSMLGGDGDDTLDGVTDFSSFDEIERGLLGDTLEGGLGNDLYIVHGNDVVSDAGGIDTIRTGMLDYTLPSGFENLTFVAPPRFDGEGAQFHYFGNELDNVIVSGGFGPRFSRDTLDGGAGNDTLIGGGGITRFKFSLALDDYGHDHLDGRGGSNTIDLSDARSAIVADLQAGTLTGGGAGGSGSATLVDINSAVGGAFNDRIVGSSVRQSREFADLAGLHGGAGNDTIEGALGAGKDLSGVDGNDLFGDDGNDRLVGRGTADWLDGGLGADTLVFAKSPGGNSQPLFQRTAVSNFVSGQDKLALDAAFHSGIGAAGDFAAGDVRFFAAAGATSGHDADDRVLYDTSTGDLYYDADGSGAGTAQLIATLRGAPTIVAADITVERNSPDLFLVGGPGNDTLTGGSGSDTLDGAGGNDFLAGAEGSDSLIGGTGDDTLDGGAASDTMDGGAGNDTYFVTVGDSLSDASGVDLVVADAATWTLGAGIENLTMASGAFNASGVGNELDNVLRYDGATRGFLQGRGGNDTLFGANGFSDDLFGEEGNDVIHGGGGPDDIRGGPGDDLLFGDDGNDTFEMVTTLERNDGSDTIDGGAGFDFIDYDNFPATGVVVDLGAGTAVGGGTGGTGSARLISIEGAVGTQFADRITGDSGANSFVGGERDDTLEGGAGNDTLEGGRPGFFSAGNDSFVFRHFGSAHADTITDFVSEDFVSGSDTVVFDASVFTALGAAGRFTTNDERFFAAAGATAGHDGSDRIIFDTTTRNLYYDADGSGSGEAQLVARFFDENNPNFIGGPAATNITVNGQAAPPPPTPLQGTAGNDSLTGTEGNDSISGLAGNDTINALGGDDTLDGGAGIDALNGGLGNDTYIMTAGDVLSDAGGIDTVVTDVSWDLAAGFENLTMSGTAGIDVTGNELNNLAIGNSGSNYFNLRAGNDTVQAGAGNDWIDMSNFGSPSYGDDVVDGGEGFDTLNFATGSGQRSGVVVDLAAGTASGGGEGGVGSVRVTGIERVIGAAFNDRISGSAGADSLEGSGGNDTLSGMGGNDSLVGGAGQDTFVFAAAPGATNVDLVADFVSATDRLALDNAAFTALGADGNFVAGDGRFAAGAGFTSGRDGDDRLVYDTSTGSLYYDADGNGAGAAQLVATFQANPAITATDITVI